MPHRRSVVFLCLCRLFLASNGRDDINAQDGKKQAKDRNAVVCDRGNKSRVNIVDQPHRIGEKIDDTDYARSLDSHGNGGKHLSGNYQKADPAVPRDQAKSCVKESKDDLKNKRAFPVLNAVTVDRIGNHRREVCRHTRPCAGNEVLYTENKLAANAQKRQSIVGFALHGQNTEPHAQKTDCLYHHFTLKEI